MYFINESIRESYLVNKNLPSFSLCRGSGNNIFEFIVPKGDFNNVVEKLETPRLTKEDLDACKRIANLYKKPCKNNLK